MLKKVLLSLLVLLILGVSLTVAGYLWIMQPVDATATQSSSFVIPKGQAVTVIARRLTEAGLIKHPLIFRFTVKRLGLEAKLQAGSFSLSPNMSPTQIATQLTQGTEDVWITILEGWRIEEVADMLDRQEELTEFDRAEFLRLAQGSEGYLYPDTYLVPRLMTSAGFFELFTDTFDKKIVSGLATELANSDRSLEDIITLASIVEREARGYEEMRTVAGILWQRLEVGMALQVDASLQYTKGYDKVTQTWWPIPTSVDRQTPSAFNTYLNPGLPPRPIANPSLEAVKATLNPADSTYVFYIHDRQGKIHYATTYDEHLRNIATYLR